MHSTHAILVNTNYAANAAKKTLSEMTKEEIEEMVINYAENYTDCFYGFVFDGRELMEDDPVLFASDNWEAFEEMLLSIDRNQKNNAKHMLSYLKEEAGSTDVSEILSNLLLANDRTANREDVDSNTWRFDFLNQGAWALKQIANLIHGDYTFESEFYDTSRGTALVPFIAKLKENPSEWALVQFDYHN